MFNRNVVTLCLLTIFSLCSPSCALVASERVEGRILGGAAATAATLNRASVASIRFYNLQISVHVCGGFIINRRWVGTAAQCMEGKTTSTCVVAVGSLTLTGGILYPLDRIEKHENYNETTLMNDIAVLRTNRDITFGSTVQQIRVATEPLAVGRTVMILGWGRTAATGALPENLMAGDFTTITLENCLTRFPYVAGYYITNDHICASFATRATCAG